MKVFGIAGWSGSGKTTLMLKLIPELRRRGLVMATMKHTHHGFEVQDDGMRAVLAAGAFEALAVSPRRWAVAGTAGGEPAVPEFARRIAGVDLVLVEGFKHGPHPRIEVHRPSLGKPLLCPDATGIVAVASDVVLAGLAVPCLSLDDIGAIADLAVACAVDVGKVGVLRP